MRFTGVLFWLSHRLASHCVAGIRMDLLGAGLCLVAGALAFRSGERHWAALLLALAATSVAIAAIARRRGYVVFRLDFGADPRALLPLVPPDSELPVRATGHFAIRDQVRYLVEQEAILTTPRSREHIVMARLRRTRLLLIGQSRADSWGWWYQFIKPEDIERVERGAVAHGWHLRPALRVIYENTDCDGNVDAGVTLLSFESEEALATAWGDLTLEQRARAATV